MAEFRYAQFCPLARATEILGERWTLLLIRELLLGPQRFSDLRRRLPGVSPSVLSARVSQLEERGIVVRRELPPPAAASVIELSELGRGLRPVVVELVRWGMRVMDAPRPGDHFEPSWLRLGLYALARSGPTPDRRILLRVPDASQEWAICVTGGERGTRVEDEDAAGPGFVPEASVRAPAPAIFALVVGDLEPGRAARDGEIETTGDVTALAELPALFDCEGARSTTDHPQAQTGR